MSKTELFFFALFLGVIIGGVFVSWISWSYLHEKIAHLESSIHGRLGELENKLMTRLHIVQPKSPANPPAAIPPAATPPAANGPQSTQAKTDTPGS